MEVFGAVLAAYLVGRTTYSTLLWWYQFAPVPPNHLESEDGRAEE
jgi:hypothetical protein